jgi:hypothetical protein
MERRKFINRLLGVMGAGIIAPQIIKGAIPAEEEDVNFLKANYTTPNNELAVTGKWSEGALTNQEYLTDELFKYLETHVVGFKWERVEQQFQTESGHGRTYECVLRKLQTEWTPELAQDLTYWVQNHEMEEEIKNTVIRNVVKELETENQAILDGWKENGLVYDWKNIGVKRDIYPTFHINRLITTPVVYDPHICSHQERGC